MSIETGDRGQDHIKGTIRVTMNRLTTMTMTIEGRQDTINITIVDLSIQMTETEIETEVDTINIHRAIIVILGITKVENVGQDLGIQEIETTIGTTRTIIITVGIIINDSINLINSVFIMRSINGDSFFAKRTNSVFY